MNDKSPEENALARARRNHEIKERFKNGESVKSLAFDFRVSEGTIWRAIREVRREQKAALMARINQLRATGLGFKEIARELGLTRTGLWYFRKINGGKKNV